MKILGVWLPRMNQLKALLPVMMAARNRGIGVRVFLASRPGGGKEALDTAPLRERFRQQWPWADWSSEPLDRGALMIDAMAAHGVVHNEKVINSSGVPWVAVDHLGENAWWYLTGHPETWEPWHRVCLSGAEGKYLPAEAGPKAYRTGYTAFDWSRQESEAIWASYGLPDRYLLLGTAVHGPLIPGPLWASYFAPNIVSRVAGLLASGYTGPTYQQIVKAIRKYADKVGLPLVGKSRWKHSGHRINRLLDYHLDDEPTDPGRPFHLMHGAVGFASIVSGMSLEALAADVPCTLWSFYDPLKADPPGFREIRKRVWIDYEGLWAGTYRLDQGAGRQFLESVGDGLLLDGVTRSVEERHRILARHGCYLGPESRISASVRVLEACGLL